MNFDPFRKQPVPCPPGEEPIAHLIRSRDWSATSLGPREQWSPALCCAIDMMLGCGFPATVQWGPDLILFYNDAYVPLIGSRHPAALGQPILNSFPEIAPTYRPLVERVWRGEPVVVKDLLYRYARHDQHEDLWFDLSYSPIHDPAGAVSGVFAVGLETTARMIAERARSQTDLRLRRVLETDAVGVIFFNLAGTVIDANDVFLRMTGYTKADIDTGSLHWRVMTPPEWVAESEAQMRNFAATGRIGPYEKEYILKDGSRRWMLFAGRDLGDGTIAEYCIDISDRKAAEKERRTSEERFRALVNATSDVVYRMSPDWTEMRQLQGKEFLADTEVADPDWLQKYIHPDDQPTVLAAILDSIRGRSIFQLEHRVLRADGSPGWTFSRAVPILDPSGAIVEWFGAANDITARKQAEEALLRSEKLATLGRLAASISHEINNPLEATTNLIYLARNAPGLPPEARDHLDLADGELRRVAHITRQSLGFYREATRPTLTGVAEILDAAIDLLRGKIAARSAIIDQKWDESLRVVAVPGELRQVFSNLLANSVDALDYGGRIAIRAALCHCLRDSQRMVRITFADSGKGIRPEIRHHIFDPLFTTKGNHGTGLGLWVSKQIIDKHGGSIRMKSRTSGPFTGTVFSIFLPEGEVAA